MKKLKIFIVLAFIAAYFWSCEKDDICEDGTPTTPHLIVEFYDDNNPTEVKNVTNLAVVEVGRTDTLRFNEVSKIPIPLKTTENETRFHFVLNSTNKVIAPKNIDALNINYTRNDVFISRACGYKTVFTLNNPGGFDVEEETPASDNWIQEGAIQQYNILNEDEVHVKIFF